jgi:alkylation response protein AidB-like acyl-CoA dehydrogenase
MLEDTDKPDELVTAIVDLVDRWGSRLDARALDKRKSIPPEVLAEMAEMGLFGLTLPEAHGGLGLGLDAACAVIARLARYDRSVATTLGLHLGLGTRGLVRWGTPEQHARWIPRLATGELVAAFATTEPDAGSDLMALRTTIAASEGGLSVNGSKIFVTNGALAHLYTISGRSPGLGGAKRGQSVVLLERSDAGFQVGPEEDKLGLRASSTTTLAIEGVQVDMDRLLGVPGTAPEMLRHILAWGRTVMAAGCCGTGAAALSAARAHTATRVQFGRTLDQLGVVREQLADMTALLFACEALVHEVAIDEAGLEVRSLSAKVIASEGGGELCDMALQLHGGYGYIEETGLALLVRDARITRIFEGANDVLRVHRGLFAAAGETFVVTEGPLAPLTELLATLIADTRARLGSKLGGDHRALHQIGSIAMLRDACEAAFARAEREGGRAHVLAARWLSIASARALAIRARTADPSATDACLETP